MSNNGQLLLGQAVLDEVRVQVTDPVDVDGDHAALHRKRRVVSIGCANYITWRNFQSKHTFKGKVAKSPDSLTAIALFIVPFFPFGGHKISFTGCRTTGCGY